MKFLSRLDDFEHIVIDGSVSGTGLSSLYLKDTATPILRIGNNTGDSFITYDGSELSISSDVDLRLTTPTDQDVFLITSSGNIVTTQAGGTFTIGGGLTLEAITGGFLKADANGVVSVDNSTYLTNETDTLDSVTDRGNTTTNNITVNDVIANGNITSANNYLIYDSTDNDRAVMLLDATDNLVLQTGTASGSRGILFKAEGAERMRIAHTGNVGIGTTSPQSLLHISSGTSGNATLIIESDTDNNNENENPQLQFRQDGGITIAKAGLTGDAGQIFGNSLANAAYFGNDENASVQFYTNATAALTIREDGDVGIGTTSPSQKLHVVGKALITDDVQLTGSNPRLDFNSNGASSLRFYDTTNATERMRINESGNVGIGDTAPSFILDVNNTSSRVRFKAATGDSNLELSSIAGRDWLIQSKDDGVFRIYDEDAAAARLSIDTSGNLQLPAYGAGILKTDASGNVSVDTSAYLTSYTETQTLDDVTTLGATTTNAITVGGVDSTGGVNITRDSSNTQLKLKRTTSATGEFNIYTNTDSLYFQNVGQSTYPMMINSSGYVGIGTTNPVGLLTVQGDDADIYLRSNDYTIARIINRGSSGTNLDTGLFSLMRSDGTNNNVEKVRLDAGGNSWLNGGSIGIGTDSPGAKLDVNSGISTSSTDVIKLSQATNGAIKAAASLGISIQNGGESTNAADLWFTTATGGSLSEAMRITSGGNVGIGNTAPNNTLTVGSNLSNTSTFNHDSLIENLMVRGSGSAPANLWLHKDDQTIFDTNDLGSIKFSGHNGTDSVTGGRIWMEASEDWSGSTNSTRLSFSTTNGTTSTTGLVIEPDGAIQLPQYTAGYLKSDASGNVSVDTTTYIPTTDYDDFVNVAGDTMTGDLTMKASEVKFTDSSNNIRLQLGNITGTSPYEALINTQNYHLVLQAVGVAQNDIKFRTGTSSGTDRMIINQAGNVGIGTTNPSENLHVVGKILSRYGSSTNHAVIEHRDTSDNVIFSFRRSDGAGGNGNDLVIRAYEDIHLAPNNSDSSKLVVKADGNVGIGNNAPTARLSVTGVTSTTEPTMKIQSGTSNVYGMMTTYDAYHGFIMRGIPAAATTYGVTAGDQMSFFEYGGQFRFYEKNNTGAGVLNEIVRLDKSDSFFTSNVGIGTTSPNNKLDVRRANSGIVAEFHSTAGTPDEYVDVKLISGNTTSGTYGTILRHQRVGTDGADFAILTNPTLTGTPVERFRITRDGEVGIGTDNPNQLLHTVGGTVKIESDGGNAAGAILELKHANNNTTDVCATINMTNNAGGYAAIEGGTTGANNTGYIAFKTDNAGTQGEAMRIIGNGNVGIGITSPLTLLTLSANLNNSVTFARDIDTIGALVHGVGTAGAEMWLHRDDVTIGDGNALGRLNFSGADGGSYVGASILGQASGAWSSTNSRSRLIFETTSDGATSPSEKMRIQDNGNVGIGTTDPKTILEVSNASPEIGFLDTGANDRGSIHFQDGKFEFYTNTTTAGKPSVNGSQVLTILKNGNVGINSTSPGFKLQINHGTTSEYVSSFRNTADNLQLKIGTTTGALLNIQGATVNTNAAYNIALQAEGGNVGIGTASPGNKLHIKDGASGFTGTFDSRYKSIVEASGEAYYATYVPDNSFSGIRFNNTSGLRAYIDYYHGTQGEYMLYSAQNHHRFAIGTTEKMRLSSVGNLGIGTTNPTQKLTIGQSGDTINYIRIIASTTDLYLGSNSNDPHLGVTNGAKILQTNSYPLVIGTTSNQELFLGANNAKIATLVDGKFGIGTTTPATKLHVVGTAETRLRVGSSNASSNVVLELRDENTPTGQGTVITYNNSTGETYFNNAMSTATTDFHFQSGEYGTANDFFTLSNSGGNAILHLKTTSGDSFITYEDSTNELAVASDGDLRLTTPTDQDVFFISSSGNIDMTQAGGTVDMGGDLVVSGDVGIGTASPDAPLHVSRSTNGINQYIYNSSSGQAYIALGNATTGLFSQDFTSANGMLVGVDSDETAVVWNAENTRLRFGTNNSERLSITGGGNVGIGTTAPGEKLVIAGGVLAYGNTSSFGSGTSYFLGNNPNSRDIAFTRVANAELGIGRYNGGWYETMRFDADGNVGIGTTNPTEKLQVEGNIKLPSTSGNGLFFVSGSAPSGLSWYSQPGTSDGPQLISYGSAHVIIDSDNNDADTRFFTIRKNGTNYANSTELLRVTESGNVGIGTTAPQQALHIKGATNGLMMLEGDNDNGLAGCYYKTEDTDNTMNRTKGFFGFQGNHGYGLGYFTMWLDTVGDNGQVTSSEEKFRWKRNGDFHADGDVIAYSTTTPSDIRLKTDVETIESASEKVSKLRGVEYTWSKGKLAGQREIGLIAQEVEAVVPEVVKEKELPLWDDSGESYKTVDYEKLVALLIESNKEMQEEIKQLKERLDGFTK